VLILIVASGADKGKIYEVHDDQQIELGQDCEQIKLNDRKVSHRHAQLACENGSWYITDLDSRHGIYHKLIEPQQKVALQDGDYLQIGGTVFVVARIPAAHAEHLALLDDPLTTATKPEARGVAAWWRPRSILAADAAPGTRGPACWWRQRSVLAIAAAIIAAVIVGFSTLDNRRQTNRVQQELAEVRAQSINNKDELLAAVRQEMRATLSQTRFAIQPVNTMPIIQLVPQTMTAHGTADTSLGNLQSIVTTPVHPLPKPTNSDSNTDEQRPLTPTEEAYKLAFETGQLIPLGRGKLNPVTGEISKGRILDRAVARAGGMQTWRQWYLADDFSERMRLQKQAMRHLDEAEHQDVIRLPPAALPQD